MLAARNRQFRLAAMLVAVGGLLLAARYIDEVAHLSEFVVPGGYVLSTVLYAAVSLVAIPGWLAIAGAFGPEIDWRRMRLGATIVVSTYLAALAAAVLRLVPVLGRTHDGDHRGIYISAAASAVLVAAGACVAASGFTDARRGPDRATRLWLGAILVTAGYAATAVGQGFQYSLYSSEGTPHEFTIGALAMAVGAVGVAVAALVFTRAARRPLVRRETSFAAAAAVAAVASLCIAGGEAVFAVTYSTDGAPGWEATYLWLALAARFLTVIAFVAVCLGARRVGQGAQTG